jgi:putative spermidine/putrescine transport system permease protein
MNMRKPRRQRHGGGASRAVLVAFCALVFVFLMLPLVIIFPISFSSAAYLRFPPPGFSWQWYLNYLGDPSWIDSTLLSLGIAFATTGAALAIGVPLAFALTRAPFFGRIIIERAVAVPLIVPTIILSIAIYGLFARLQLIGTWYGITIAHTMLALPFVVIIVTSGLKSFDINTELAARGLGASKWQAVRRVTLPQIKPSLISAGLLAFITSFDELIIAMFLSGANMTLPKKMFDNIRMEIDPTIAAISALQILLVGILLLVGGRFGARSATMLDSR